MDLSGQNTLKDPKRLIQVLGLEDINNLFLGDKFLFICITVLFGQL